MGSCISKCQQKTTPIECNCHQIQDKLVISQVPKLPSVPLPKDFSKKQTPSSFSSSSSSSSSLSSSCPISLSTESSWSSTSASSSSASTSSISTNNSFSNDFLRSCIKENPHIIPAYPSKLSPACHKFAYTQPKKATPIKFGPPTKAVASPKKQSSPQPTRSQPPKRLRSNSPALDRQKSFRKEHERRVSAMLPGPNARSHSPNRRFDGDTGRDLSKNLIGGRVMSNAKKENSIRPMSPSNLRRDGSFSKKRETLKHHIHSQIDQNTVGRALSSQDSESFIMEDIDNPLISLDCFIFL